MKKRDYFLKAMNAGAYRYKSWVIQAFSMTRGREEGDGHGKGIPFFLYADGKSYYYLDPESGEGVYLEDVKVDEPPFSFKDKTEVMADEVTNLSEDATVSYGNLLANYVALVYPFGGKIEFVQGNFSIKAIESQIEKRLTTDEAYLTKKDFKADSPIYVEEYLTFIDAILSLEGYSQLCVPSATQKTMTTDPEIPRRRKELLEEHKDSLDDPATIAKIEQELIQMDKEWMKGDLGEGFYRKSKSYDVVRKRSHLMFGGETGFGDGQKVDLVVPSLDEGWDLDKLPSMINTSRAGSHKRGSMTALGGEATKTINRIFQNYVIKGDDCGTKLGWETTITKANVEKYIGFYYVGSNGPKLITDKNHGEVVGKTLVMRSPQFCKTPRTGLCKACVGEVNAQNPSGLSALPSEMTSQLMNIMMAAMHGKALKTTKYDPAKVIS